MKPRLVWVNHAQIAFEREMQAWLAWVLREDRCIACEALGAEFEDRSGYPLCDDCGIAPEAA